MKRTKTSLLKSALALLLCLSMLVGSTFAWFSDSVTSKGNIIHTGNLDIQMYWTDDLNSGTWYNVEEDGYNTIFSYDKWEPGYTDVKYIKLVNNGNLALNYKLTIDPQGAVGKLAEVINVYFANSAVDVQRYEDLSQLKAIGLLSNVLGGGATAEGTLLAADQQNPNHSSGEVIVTIAMNMITSAGNDYQNETSGNFTITGLATQAPYESDSFGANYDANGEYPALITSNKISAPVTAVDGKVPEGGVAMSGGGISAFVPQGVALEDNADQLTLSITPLETTTSGITVVNNEILIPVDVHIAGVSEENDVPIVIDLGQILPKYMNMGNYHLYHIEDGQNQVMTLVGDHSQLTAHNQFTYDPLTGAVSVAMASFSEVALVADTSNGWNGKYDYTWYNTEGKEFKIANADQFAAFGAIVGGMAKNIERDSFANKTVTLLSDINLNNGTALNDADGTTKTIFYPIGYYNNKGFTNDTTDGVKGNRPTTVVGTVESTVYSFAGTFNGNGHTISNIYQNTWEMFGDYNDGYSGTPNYYKDAMGLFGYVYGGTIKNLTVHNFSCDGEFTPTGVIAAYADGNATFENIAITKCNPRVYNTGNGGIIGIAGDTSAADDDHITLTNITVDNSNKISALWGSYDVACGGLVGMYRGNVDGSGNATGDTISFKNCHVAAQIDVYNDVCGNYQYYAYRYAGMIIGSVRHNTTNDEGKTIPNMAGISATGCTVNYGDWNDYYYCEFIKNGHPSYSGPDDYKFSRVPNNEIDITNGKENATCIGHNHTEVEDNQAIYLPFHQLFTGYSWGVSSIGLKEYSGIVTDLGITEGDQNESVEKFNAKLDGFKDITADKPITIGDLFDAKDGATINGSAVQVAVSALNNSGITAVYEANGNDWKAGTLTFDKVEGLCSVSIQDYNFCKPTTVILQNGNVYDVFAKKFTGSFLYRVGNKNVVSLSSLFEENNIAISDSSVKVEVTGGIYTANNDDWTKGTIQFDGTGIATVTIQDTTYANITTLKLEVVDAVNATTAANATANNVVLLQNCGFSSLEVSGGYTLYGNGFTMTCSKDTAALDMGYSFVTLNNGTLDNVQIVTPNFDHAVLYKSNMTESSNRSETTDKTRYFNVKSGVMVSGNSQILNSRISGARAAVNVTGGNCLIDNSRIEGGAVASLLVGSANSVTLRDITLVQKPTASTYDPNKTLMGFSVLLVCDADGNAAPITLEGTLIQNAWVDENDKEYVPSAGQSIISTVLEKTEYRHDLDGDGTKESLNLGFAYMPESLTSKVNTTTITDNRTNKNDVPYDYAEISVLNGKTYVYSYKNTNGTSNEIKNEGNYTPNTQSDNINVTYSDSADGLTTGKSFGAGGWVYELNVDLDKLSGYAIDFSKLAMSINGTPVTDLKVNGEKCTDSVAVTAGGVTYTLSATVEGKEYVVSFKVTGTETSKESPSKISGPTAAGFGVAKSYGGDWSGAADVLTGVKIKYWSVAENKYVEFDFSNFTVPGNAGKLNSTNNYWEYTHTNNDFTLKVTNTVAIHSGKSVYGMPIRGTDGKLYFTISSTNGYVGTGTTSRAVTMQYEFTDNNGGDKLTFTHTFNISYSKDEQYSYSDLSGSGKLTKLEKSSGNECITPDTLITLANGKQVRVDSLKGDEMLLVWNLETGKYEAAPIVFVDNDAEMEYEIVHLYFSDGSDVKVIGEHGFFDLDLGKYVYIDAENYADYVGHKFVKEGNKFFNTWKKITLEKVVLEKEVTTAWSPVTFEHLCYYTNGVLSMPGGIDGLFNIFEVNTNRMRYDAKKMQKDIETYGLFTYEDFGGMIPEIAFEAFNGDYLKVAIGKGLLTWETIAALAERYIPLM